MKKLFVLIILLFSVNSYANNLQVIEDNCNKGDLKNCVSLDLKYHEGIDGVTQDFNKAKVLYDKACKLKEQLGCNNYNLLKNALKK